MRKYFFMMLLLVAFNSSASDLQYHERTWLSLIENQLGVDCIKESPVVESAVIGNNGFRAETWMLLTCDGNKRFSVTYYPAEFFPDKKSEHEILEKRIE